jgi:hypothetical protein
MVVSIALPFPTIPAHKLTTPLFDHHSHRVESQWLPLDLTLNSIRIMKLVARWLAPVEVAQRYPGGWISLRRSTQSSRL